jgi:YD repeat-containing protein
VSEDLERDNELAYGVGEGSCNADTWINTNKAYAEMKPDHTYYLSVLPGGPEMCAVHINFFEVPDEYTLEIDDKETTTVDKSGFFPEVNVWRVVLRRKCPCAQKGAGEGGPRLGSVVWELGLGDLSDGRSAQSIGLRERTLSARSYTPAALIYSPPARSGEVDVVRGTNGSLRQVRAPQTLANVITVSSTEYDIRFYRAADVGAKVGGVYSVSGQPFVTWKVKNPDPSSFTRLQIAKTQNGVTDTSEYIWDVPSNSWSLSTGGGVRVESKTVTYPTPNSRTETTIVKNSGGQVISKVARTYNTFPWAEELVQEVIDPDGAALKTIYAYYDVASKDEDRYTKVKSVTNPDGSWEKYDYDSSGNKKLVLRPWKDLTLAAATEDNSYATYYTYSNTDGIEVSLHAKLISSVTEKVAGVTVRKTTYARSADNINGEPAVTEVQTVYSSATASQATSTTTYHSSASALLANRVASTVYPDGRKDTYIYEKGNYAPNVDPSLSRFTVDANGQAARETVVHGTADAPAGVAFKTTQETSVLDQFGHTVLQETNVYNGGGYERIAWSVMDYDDRGHLIQTRRHDGQATSSTWSGDQKVSDVDASGVETTYTYDALGRVKTQTKKGIAAGGSFPAQVDIVTTLSYDAEGRQTSQTVAGGSLSLSNSSVYDTAGRLKSETDQAGLVTAYTYANGGRVQTKTLPGWRNPDHG